MYYMALPQQDDVSDVEDVDKDDLREYKNASQKSAQISEKIPLPCSPVHCCANTIQKTAQKIWY